MITEIALDNFKALKRVEIPLGRITVFIGANGSGKSSALQALALLKQSLGKPQLISNGPTVNLGDPIDLIHNKEVEKVATISVSFEREITPVEGLGPQTSQTYSVSWDSRGLVSHRVDISQPVSIQASQSRAGVAGVEPPRHGVGGGSYIDLTVSNKIGRLLAVSSWAGQPVPEEVQNGWQQFLAVTAQELTETYVVPAVRGLEVPSYPLLDSPTQDFVTVAGPSEHASKALSTLAYRRELEAEISSLSRRILGVQVRVRLMEGRNVAGEAFNGSSINLVNEGFGLNQLTLTLAQSVVAPRGSLLGIEEPEIHLHPGAQAALCDVFVDWATNEGKRLVLTTHSEHILLGLLTQVAQERLDAEDLKVYYFVRDKNGVASPEPLEVSPRGQLKGGLKGFFETNVSELDAYLGAVGGPEQE